MVQISQDGEPITGEGIPSTLTLEIGDVIDLPGGYGTPECESVDRFVALDVRHDPAVMWVLITASAAIFGLIGSLFTPRRRGWLRATPAAAGRTLVAAGGLTLHARLG